MRCYLINPLVLSISQTLDVQNFCLWILLVMLIAVSSYFVYRRRKSSRIIAALQQDYEKSEHEKEQEQLLNSCLDETLKLNWEICKKQAEEIKQYKQSLEKLQKISAKEQISSSSCYQDLLALIEKNRTNPDQTNEISETHWNQIIVEIDFISPEFTKRLSEQYEYLLESDIHFCCLVKLGFKYSDMALLLSCTANAVYKRKYTILDKMKVENSIGLEAILNDI